jgi:hypothetical protein
MPPLTLSCLVAWSVGLTAIAAAHPLDEWHECAPRLSSQALQDIDYDGGQFVVLAAGSKSKALVSRDLKEWGWREIGLPDAVEPHRIAFNGKRHVIIAGGRVWTRNTWDGEWVKVTDFQTLPSDLRVLNGEFWAWNQGGIEEALLSRKAGGGPVAVASPILHRSRDGITWEVVLTPPVDNRQIGIDDLIYAEGAYLLLNGGKLFHSSDGTNWTSVPDSEKYFVCSVAYGSGIFVAGDPVNFGVSEDGKSWSFNEHPFVRKYRKGDPSQGFRDVSTEGCPVELGFSGGKFVAIAGNPDISSERVAFSSDGKKWSTPLGRSGLKTRLRQVGDNAFALGEGGALWVADPEESRLRQLLPVLPWDWKAVAANEQRVVVGGEGGHVAWSDDAITFTPVLLPDPAAIQDIVWSPELKRFVAVGGGFGPDPSPKTKLISSQSESARGPSEYGRVWTSTNGIDWTTGTLPPTSGRITGVAWNGAKFVICGYNGQIATSTDGSNWTAQESGTEEMIYDVEWGGGNFVASVFGGSVLTSSDGIKWALANLGVRITSIPGPSPVYGNDTWIIPHGGSIYWSNDLKDWNRSEARDASCPALFAFGEFIASGRQRVVSSINGLDWTPHTDKAVTHGRVFSYSGFQSAARFRQQIIYVGNGGRISVSGMWP